MTKTWRPPSGVYMILNVINNKRYVGAGARMRDRWSSHRINLRKCTHPNWKLQMEWDAYGEDAFKFVEIERCRETRFDREKYWLDRFRQKGFGLYNINPDGQTQTGHKWHPIQKARQSRRKMGEKHNMSPEGLAAIRKATSRPRPDVAEMFAKDWPDLVGPDGTVYRNIHNLLALAREHGLDMSAIRKVALGQRPSHKGFRLAP